MDSKLTAPPAEEFRIYRRKLPHCEQRGSTYFITFKTSNGFTLSDEAKNIVFDTVKFHANKKYEVHAAVVMETHVHLVLEPLEQGGGTPCSLAEITHSIKGYTAKRIQKVLGRRGSVWTAESYDRIIRDDAEYQEKLNYIVNNPLKAGIVENPADYRWLFYLGQEKQ